MQIALGRSQRPRWLLPLRHHPTPTGNLLQACHHAAASADQYVRQLLRWLAATYHKQMQLIEPGSEPRRIAAARAEFYDSLADARSLASTPLHHPFLDLPKRP